jgi:hypothetical protein
MKQGKKRMMKERKKMKQKQLMKRIHYMDDEEDLFPQ